MDAQMNVAGAGATVARRRAIWIMLPHPGRDLRRRRLLAPIAIGGWNFLGRGADNRNSFPAETPATGTGDAVFLVAVGRLNWAKGLAKVAVVSNQPATCLLKGLTRADDGAVVRNP